MGHLWSGHNVIESTPPQCVRETTKKQSHVCNEVSHVLKNQVARRPFSTTCCHSSCWLTKKLPIAHDSICPQSPHQRSPDSLIGRHGRNKFYLASPAQRKPHRRHILTQCRTVHAFFATIFYEKQSTQATGYMACPVIVCFSFPPTSHSGHISFMYKATKIGVPTNGQAKIITTKCDIIRRLAEET